VMGATSCESDPTKTFFPTMVRYFLNPS